MRTVRNAGSDNEARKIIYTEQPEHCGKPMLPHSDDSWACSNDTPEYTCPVSATDRPTNQEVNNSRWVGRRP